MVAPCFQKRIDLAAIFLRRLTGRFVQQGSTAMAKQPHDDLFEGGTMSFGEHLEELRTCLFRSLIGVLIGCCVGLYAAEYVVRFFEGPLEEALIDHYVARALNKIDVDFKQNPPPEYRNTITIGSRVRLRVGQ
jgi:hypothetical protein